MQTSNTFLHWLSLASLFVLAFLFIFGSCAFWLELLPKAKTDTVFHYGLSAVITLLIIWKFVSFSSPWK